MNDCNTYREAIAAEPWLESDEHVSQCAPCQAFRDELRALDRQIATALLVPVPELNMPELAEVDASNVTTLAARRISVPAWLAVAATVTIAAVLGFRMLDSELSYPSLADEIIAHLDHEPYALRVTDKAVSDARLARVVPADVATIDTGIGLFTYAQSCVIDGKRVPHLVIQGERGPITILLMPEQKVDTAQRIDGQSINGMILPVGDGSIAIIGETGEDLERIQNNVKSSVTWST